MDPVSMAGCGPIRCYGDGLAVVTATRSPLPAAFLRSVRAATSRPARVVVAGAGETDGAELVPIREDVGRAAAANRAIAGLDVGIGWVVVADPDVEWAAGALDGLLAAGARYPRAGALGPRLRDRIGATLPSAGPLPSARDLISGRVGRGPAAAGPVGWLAASCLLLRRAAWDSVDGFDPRYAGAPRTGGPDPGDLDLGDRLARSGWLVVHVPTAEATVNGCPGPGMLEPGDRGVLRYVRDRHRAPVSAAVAVGLRLRAARDGRTRAR